MADEPRTPESEPEPETGPTDPETGPTEPETGPTEPQTGATEPMTAGDPLAAGDPPPATPPSGGDVPPSDGPKRLTRSGSDRIIGGVSGGLGRYFDVDPIIFRIAFVVATFFGGLGLLAYIGLLAFVPSDGSPSSQSRSMTTVGAVVLGVAVVAFLAPSAFFLGPALLPIALVVLVGVLLYRAISAGKDGDRDPARIAARVALAVLLVVVAFGGFLGIGAAAAFGGGTVIAVLAIVAGLVLAGTAFLGGARWLILPAVILVLPLAIVAAADIDIEGGAGEREYRPSTVSELRDRYELGTGSLVLDLRDLDLPAGRTDVAVDVGLGEALVYVPADACVSSDVRIGIGHAEVLARDSDGIDIAYANSTSPPAGAPLVHIDADVGVGHVQVRRGSELGGGVFGWRDFDDDGDEPVRLEADGACP